MEKRVADRAVERIDRLDEHDQVGAGKFAKQARGQIGDFIARFELALVFEPALLRPGRKIERQYNDRDQEGRGKQQDRAQTGRERPVPEVNQTIISLSRYQRESVKQDGEK